MPTNPQTAPMPVARNSIRLNELVSIRATVGGMTSVAAISVTPTTCIVARIARREHDHHDGVDDAGAHAGRSCDLGVERREQQPPVAEEGRRRDREREPDDRPDVDGADAEHAAEQRGVEARPASTEHGEQRETERERRGGDDTDRRVCADRRDAA